MTYEEYLSHHGIEGMRWGRRNGPPYPLIRRNMSPAERAANPVKTSDSEAESKKAKTPKSEEKVSTAQKKKSVKSMSDEELNEAVSRLEKEKKYRSLAGSDLTQGREFIKSILLIGGATAATTFVANYAKTVSQNLSKQYGDGATPKVKAKIDQFLAMLKKKK